MKKPVIIAIIAVAIVAIIVVATIIGVTFINLNKEKTPITASDFYNIMSQKGYIVQEASNQVSSNYYIKQSCIAISEDYTYQIEFYELIDDSYATNFYNNNKSIFESSKGNAAIETNVGLKNYQKYTLSSNGKYMVVSRIGNTVIYIETADENKDTIKSILEEIGY